MRKTRDIGKSIVSDRTILKYEYVSSSKMLVVMLRSLFSKYGDFKQIRVC